MSSQTILCSWVLLLYVCSVIKLRLLTLYGRTSTGTVSSRQQPTGPTGVYLLYSVLPSHSLITGRKLSTYVATTNLLCWQWSLDHLLTSVPSPPIIHFFTTLMFQAKLARSGTILIWVCSTNSLLPYYESWKLFDSYSVLRRFAWCTCSLWPK